MKTNSKATVLAKLSMILAVALTSGCGTMDDHPFVEAVLQGMADAQANAPAQALHGFNQYNKSMQLQQDFALSHAKTMGQYESMMKSARQNCNPGVSSYYNPPTAFNNLGWSDRAETQPKVTTNHAQQAKALKRLQERRQKELAEISASPAK